MGASPAPQRRRHRSDVTSRAPDPHLLAERAGSSGPSRARAHEEHDSTGLLMSHSIFSSWLSRRLFRAAALVVLGPWSAARAQRLLVPMDDAQTNHLKA